MKNNFLPFLVLICGGAFAQVGIGTSTPNPSSQLEVVATDRGVLLPRVALKSSIDTTTIVGGNVNSLLVFNTNTIADVSPGYYFWYNNRWYPLGNITALLDTNEKVTGLAVDNNNLVISLENENGVVPARFVPLADIANNTLFQNTLLSNPNFITGVTAATTNNLSSSGNTITSTVNGVVATASAVNTVVNTI